MRPVVRIESAVDYITCTTTNEKDTGLMVHRAEKMAFAEMEAGNVVSTWRSSGFSGWQVGQVVYATRGDEGLAQLSGATAGYDWFDIYQLANRVTRIDVQETYRLASHVTRHVLMQYKRANAYSKAKNLDHRNDVWAGNDGGATVYLGSAKSERRMRIYNKHVESKLDHYDGCVRYELQLRNDSARIVAHHLASGAPVQQTIGRLLKQFARGRGCRVPVADVGGMPISVPRSPTDCVRALEWIRVQVSPSVRLLIKRGMSAELVDALGLSVADAVGLVQHLNVLTDDERLKPCQVSSTALQSPETTTNN